MFFAIKHHNISIQTNLCLPPLVSATTQFRQLHLCNRVQPCATVCALYYKK